MVVSRGGLPRRSASWYQCLVKPWPSVCVCAPLATNRMLRYTAGNTRMEALVLICCSKVVITPGVAANSGPSIDMSSVLRTMQRRRVESLVLGAFHHGQYTVLLCWYWGPT